MRHADRLDADHLLRLVAQQFAAGGGHISAHQIVVELEHHVGTIVGEQAVAGLALLQALLRRDPLIDVADDEEPLVGLPAISTGLPVVSTQTITTVLARMR